jgi:sialate O-acetylesterase
MRAWFDAAGEGLKVRGGGDPKGFEVAGADGQYHPAEARIDGRTVVAWSASVPSPVHVRYAWASDPVANLVNSAGLPASAFRSE